MNKRDILKKNLSRGMLAKIIGLGLSYLSVPIVLNYLGEKNYGLWITIFSILSWIYNFDVGIGNGLKNKLTEALSKNDDNLAKKYIATCYIVLVVITFCLLITGFILIFSFNYSKILNINFLNENYLKFFILINFLFVLGNFMIGLYRQMFYAIHESALMEITNVIYQTLVILFMMILKKYYIKSLFLVTCVYGISNISVGIAFTVIFFKKKKELLPNIKDFSIHKIKDIAGIGLEFFIIQICMIVIFTTDNLIITRLLGTESATSYNLIYQIYKMFLMIVTMVLTPFWVLFSEAYIRKEKKWIQNTLLKLNYLFVVLVIIELIVTFNIQNLLKIWLKKELLYPKELPWYMMINSLIMCFGAIYMHCLNGIGKIKLQLYIYIIGAILNIPLSIFFIRRLQFGSEGVILATNICTVTLALILPIQVYKIVKKL